MANETWTAKYYEDATAASFTETDEFAAFAEKIFKEIKRLKICNMRALCGKGGKFEGQHYKVGLAIEVLGARIISTDKVLLTEFSINKNYQPEELPKYGWNTVKTPVLPEKPKSAPRPDHYYKSPL